jgi:hypothetical protein
MRTERREARIRRQVRAGGRNGKRIRDGWKEWWRAGTAAEMGI